MSDPRVAPVEENLLSFFRAAQQCPPMTPLPDTDVLAAVSDIPFPLFNAVLGASFSPGTAGDRTAGLVAAYVERGLPWLWWTTPSHTSPELEAALAAAGMGRGDTPGMHRRLDGPVEAAVPAALDLTLVDVAVEPDPWIGTMLRGFDMPPDLAGPMTQVLGGVPAGQLVNILARMGGEPVAVGSGWIDDGTIGLYNIATVESARGRGIGYAVTGALLQAGHERGARQAILHATDLGRPVYERLGFEAVCLVPQWVWLPSDPGQG
ncbi:hypothetical protein GCM10009623_26340 [Nocardioides aestuarii]|uniref:GNAT family N-acetyltransferase n=1 Tax=Nocardioides aestuarii TaxID=252231 RepID=A0ABW4TPU8_9ACTN